MHIKVTFMSTAFRQKGESAGRWFALSLPTSVTHCTGRLLLPTQDAFAIGVKYSIQLSRKGENRLPAHSPFCLKALELLTIDNHLNKKYEMLNRRHFPWPTWYKEMDVCMKVVCHKLLSDSINSFLLHLNDVEVNCHHRSCHLENGNF